MTKPEIIQRLRAFIGWFEDNFTDEEWLDDDETWRPYIEIPVYLDALDALEELEKES